MQAMLNLNKDGDYFGKSIAYIMHLSMGGQIELMFDGNNKTVPDCLWGKGEKVDKGRWSVITVNPEWGIDDAILLVSMETLERSRRLYDKESRKTFLLAHGFLNLLISNYLRISPSKLQFVMGMFGKPRLLDETQCINFSISYRKNIVAVGLSCGEVGVDIEKISNGVDFFGIARKFFTTEEREYINCSSYRQIEKRFFEVWTQKEALLKASGNGLVNCQKINTRKDIHCINDDAGVCNRYVVKSLLGPSGYALAMAEIVM